MPIGGRSINYDSFRVELRAEGDDEVRARRLIESIGSIDYSRDLNDLVSTAVSTVAHYLADQGSAAFEIVCSDEHDFSAHPFTVKRLFRIPGYFVQWIPQADYEHVRRRFVFIPESTVWRVNIPGALGGRWGHRHLLRRLRRHGTIGPKFWKEELESNDGTLSNDGMLPFAIQSYTKANDAYIAQITLQWVWNLRDFTYDRKICFYVYYLLVTLK